MNKYKICPECHEKNEPFMIECAFCEADLTGVKITDEETEKMTQANAAAPAEPSAKLIRLCDCGAKNAPNARKCSACGEDISDVTPSPDIEETEAASFILSSLDGQYAYTLTADVVTIGRESVMGEYLNSKSYVSRSHAKLSLEDGELWIENLSGTNYTYVNNKRITEKTKLTDGDEVGLGGMSINGNRQEQAAYFLVRIGSCT